MPWFLARRGAEYHTQASLEGPGHLTSLVMCWKEVGAVPSSDFHLQRDGKSYIEHA